MARHLVQAGVTWQPKSGAFVVEHHTCGPRALLGALHAMQNAPSSCAWRECMAILQVRWIVEKLAKRCGFEALAQHMPEAHVKLLSHIRKENNRKERRRSEAGSQVSDPTTVAGVSIGGVALLAAEFAG